MRRGTRNKLLGDAMPEITAHRRQPGQPDPSRPWPNFPEQNADGVDLSLILERLRMTPEERVRRTERAADDCAWIRQHVRRLPNPT